MVSWKTEICYVLICLKLIWEKKMQPSTISNLITQWYLPPHHRSNEYQEIGASQQYCGYSTQWYQSNYQFDLLWVPENLVIDLNLLQLPEGPVVDLDLLLVPEDLVINPDIFRFWEVSCWYWHSLASREAGCWIGLSPTSRGAIH